MGLVSGLSLASHLACPTFGLIHGPFWQCTHLSVKTDFSMRVSGRLTGEELAGVPLPFSFSFCSLLNASRLVYETLHGLAIQVRGSWLSNLNDTYPKWLSGKECRLLMQEAWVGP